MFFKNRFRSLLFLVVVTVSVGAFLMYQKKSIYQEQQKSTVVKTVYGSVEVNEQVLLELLESPPMQRLKRVNQYGIMAFVRPHEKYNRYEHSLGVFYLLRTFGASLEEQVAGLLHDVSHTAFSHVGDFVFDQDIQAKYSYQDKMFNWYLQKTGLLDILKKHGMERVAGFGNGVEYKMLKDNLPNLCADRLEYNLYGGYVEGWLTKEQMKDIVSKIVHQDGQWIFTDQKAAHLFAKVSIDLSTKNWCSAENGFVSTMGANLIKRGIELNIINYDDLHFSVDHVVWSALQQGDDELMQKYYTAIMNHETSYHTNGTKDNHDLYFKGKFRGVDPLVKKNGELVRLSQLDKDFVTYLADAKKSVQEYYIVYTS
jgi:hypothetical protein